MAESVTDPHRLARRLLRTTFTASDVPTLRSWQDTWLEWRDGRFVEVTKSELEIAASGYIKRDFDDVARRSGDFVRHVTPTLVTKVLAALKTLVALPRETEALPVWMGPGATRWFAFRNGLVVEDAVLSLRAELRSPSPRWVSRTRFPFNYDPAAAAPRWEAFLGEVLPERADQDLLQEMFGYLLTPDVSLHKFFLLEGRGANGKGVVVKVLTELLGSENVSHVPIEVFGERFQLGPTVGKLANISNEINSVNGIAEGVLKEFVAGDRMTIDRKHRDPISVLPTARVLVTTNLLPEFRDRSDGIKRRIVPLTFGVTIPEERRDPALGDKLLAELPGVFNWAARGLKRLRERGSFAMPVSSLILLEAMQPEKSSAQEFFESQVEEWPGAFTATDDLYQAYRDWLSGKPLVPRSRFGQQLPWSYPAAKKGREGAGERRWGYLGLRLKAAGQTSESSEPSINTSTEASEL